jgi:hypothetical protein
MKQPTTAELISKLLIRPSFLRIYTEEFVKCDKVKKLFEDTVEDCKQAAERLQKQEALLKRAEELITCMYTADMDCEDLTNKRIFLEGMLQLNKHRNSKDKTNEPKNDE